MFTLYKKELNYYLNNPVGYIVLVLFAIFANFMFIKDIFLVGSASMRPFFYLLPWIFMVFIPALTMRIFSDEKKNNTMEVLLTLPISETQIVLAKFLALLSLVFFGLILTFSLPLSLSLITKIYLPEIIVGYLGQLFLAVSFISISMFFSNQTKNQIVAFLVSVIIIFLLLVMSSDFLATVLPKFLQDNLVNLTPIYHEQNFTKGIIDLRSVFYFASFSLVFLFMTIIDLEKRN